MRFPSPLVVDTTNYYMGLLEVDNIARGIIDFVTTPYPFPFLGPRVWTI